MPFPVNKMIDFLLPTVTSQEEAKEVVSKYVKKNVDYVKIICDELPLGTTEMKFETLKWIVDEVHSYNLKAVVHVGSPENAVNAIKSGADVLAHGIYRGRLKEHEAKLIADSGVPIVYTLFAFEFNSQMVQGKFIPNHYDSILVDTKILEGITGENGLKVENSHVIHSFISNLVDEKKNWQYNFDLLRKNKVKIVVGTDAGTPGFCHGTSLYYEIDELKKYGMTNFEDLNASTFLSSYTYIDNPDFGFISKGYQADLLLLDCNPLKDSDCIKEPDLIITNGRIIKRIL